MLPCETDRKAHGTFAITQIRAMIAPIEGQGIKKQITYFSYLLLILIEKFVGKDSQIMIF